MTRGIVKYGGMAVLGLVVFQWGLVTAIAAYQKAHPPYIPPTVRYGKLPKIVFPDKQLVSKTFTSEMPNDSFPKFSDQAKVYIVYRPNSTLLALDADTKTAKDLGFLSIPTELRTGVYSFVNGTTNQTLTMNVLDGSFKLEYPYLTDQMLLNPDKMPTKDEAVVAAKAFLRAGNKLTDDLENGIQKTTFWKINFDGLKPVTSLSEANVVRVDLFRKDLESEVKILPAEVGQASVSVLVSGSSVAGKRIIEVNYKYTPIDRESFATYPIKKVEDAWNDLKTGNYWPAIDNDGKSQVIRKVSMAYFEPSTLTNYMQPIFVFEGDKGFTAFVTAVKDEWATK